MPTIIALDMSLSMHRPASRTPPSSSSSDVDDVECQTLLDLAKVGVRSFLNHLDKNSKLEFVSLIGFSSQCDLICPFTRDFQEVLDKLEGVECMDNTNVVAAFKGIASYVQEQWTNSVPINILMITDEGKGDKKCSLKSNSSQTVLLFKAIFIWFAWIARNISSALS